MLISVPALFLLLDLLLVRFPVRLLLSWSTRSCRFVPRLVAAAFLSAVKLARVSLRWCASQLGHFFSPQATRAAASFRSPPSRAATAAAVSASGAWARGPAICVARWRVAATCVFQLFEAFLLGEFLHSGPQFRRVDIARGYGLRYFWQRLQYGMPKTIADGKQAPSA